MGRHPRKIVVILFAAFLFAATSFSPAQVGKGAKPKAGAALALNDKNIKDAVQRGVEFLRKGQDNEGLIEQIYPVGVATLSGLAMLEGGVDPKDAAIQQIAGMIRADEARLRKTYELSLAVLFLDRLGNKDDEALLRTFALRLVAGQNNKGGWSYSCPTLTRADEEKLLAFLQKNQPLADPLRPAEHAFLMPIGKPGGALPIPLPLPESGSLYNPLAKDEKASLQTPVPKDAKDPLRSPTTTSDKKPDPSAPDRTPAKPNQDKDQSQPDSTNDTPREKKPSGPAATPKSPLDEAGPALLSLAKKPKNDAPNKPDANPPKAQKVNPAAWPAVHAFVDKELQVRGGARDSFGDNSNTQFAIMALWVGRRHQIPMALSLAALDKRFRESQNANGAWPYLARGQMLKGFDDFPKLGGPGFPKGFNLPKGFGVPKGALEGLGTPSMTCVGLLGLGVSHGSFREAMRIEPKQVFVDPAIQKGMKFIGATLRQNAELPNAYLLWSIERVGMLYNLKKIDGQDWYALGAKTLLHHQQPSGAWRMGGFHGSQESIDTAMAILFLTRSHLNRDLTDRLQGFILAEKK